MPELDLDTVFGNIPGRASDPLRLGTQNIPGLVDQTLNSRNFGSEEDTGFFNTIASVFSIPQQVLYTVGKNIGEELAGRELQDAGFIEELFAAASGNSRLSFNDVLRSVNAEGIDMKLPDELQIKNPWARIPIALAVGAAAGFTTGPFAGLVAGFGTNDLLSGKGAVSTAADLTLDPLNKLRILQHSARGKAILASKDGKLADDLLSRIALGEQNLFDLKGSLFGAGNNPVDVIMANASKPIELIGENAGKLLNTPPGKLVRAAINPFTSTVDNAIVQPLSKAFIRNGTVDLEQFPFMGDFENALSEIQVTIGKGLLSDGTLEQMKKLKPSVALRTLMNSLENAGKVKEVRQSERIIKLLDNQYTDQNLLEGIGSGEKKAASFRSDPKDLSQVRDVVSDIEQVEGFDTLWNTVKRETQLLEANEFKTLVKQNPEKASFVRDYNKEMTDVSNSMKKFENDLDNLLTVEGNGLLKFNDTFTKANIDEKLQRIGRDNGITVELGEPTSKLIDGLRAKQTGSSEALEALYERSESLSAAMRKTISGSTTERAERKLFADMLPALFGKESSESIRLLFSDAGAFRNVNEGTESAVKIFTSLRANDPNSIVNLSVAIAGSARPIDAFAAIGRTMLDNLTPDKVTELQNLYSKYLRPGQAFKPSEMNKWFEDNFLSSAQYGQKRIQKSERKFFSKVVDTARGFLRMVMRGLRRDVFVDDKVAKDVFDFVQDVNFFKTAKVESRATNFLVAETKSEFLKDLVDMQSSMKAAGTLPDYIGNKPTGQGIVRIPLTERSEFILNDIKQKSFDVGAIKSSDIDSFTTGREALYSSPAYIDKLATYVKHSDELVNMQLLSKADAEVLKGLGEFTETGQFKFRGNVNEIADPMTPAWEAMQKVDSVFEIIPYNVFDSSIASLEMHLAKGWNSITAAATAEAISKYTFVTEANYINRARQSLLANMDVIHVNAEAVEDITKIVSKFGAKGQATIEVTQKGKKLARPESLDVQDEVIKLLKKPDLTFDEGDRLREGIVSLMKTMPDSAKQELNSLLADNLPLNIQDVAISPTLTSYGQQNRILKREAVINPDGFAGNRLNTTVDPTAQLGKLLNTKATGQAELLESSTFRKIVDEIEGKRGGAALQRTDDLTKALGVHEGNFVPSISKETIAGARVLTKDQLADYGVEAFEIFDPVKKLPPVLEKMRGHNMPKVLLHYLTGSEINLGKTFAGIGKAADKLISGLEKEEVDKIVGGTFDTVENSSFGKRFIKGKNYTTSLRNLAESTVENFNFDYFTQLFKSQILMSPGYHVRNGISGTVVNLMHGVTPKAHTDALHTMYKLAHNIDLDSGTKKLWDEFLELGGTGAGDAGDLARAAKSIEKKGFQQPTINPLSTNALQYKVNFELGGYVEDVMRFAAFTDFKLGKVIGVDAMDAQRAMEQVKLLHFDYNDLSAFEKNVMKRLIPFYSYFRKAIARDSRMFMERAGNFYKMAHVIGQVERGVEDAEDSSVVGAFVKDKLGVPVRRNENGNMEYFLLQSWIPAADITRFFLDKDGVISPTDSAVEFFGEIMQSVNPLLKVPVEQAINYDFYFGKKIEEYEGEETDFWGMGVSKKSVKFLRSVRFLNDMDKMIKTQVRGAARPELAPVPLQTGLSQVFLGGRLLENRDPARQFQINRIRPLQEARREVTRLRRVQRQTGEQPSNLTRAEDRLRKAQEAVARDRPKAKKSINRGNKGQANPVDQTTVDQLFSR